MTSSSISGVLLLWNWVSKSFLMTLNDYMDGQSDQSLLAIMVCQWFSFIRRHITSFTAYDQYQELVLGILSQLRLVVEP